MFPCLYRSIVGVSDEPLPIQFISDNRDKTSNDLPIARSSSPDFNLQTLYVLQLTDFRSSASLFKTLSNPILVVLTFHRELYNIDLDDVIRKTKGFIPTTVTNLYEPAFPLVLTAEVVVTC